MRATTASRRRSLLALRALPSPPLPFGPACFLLLGAWSQGRDFVCRHPQEDEARDWMAGRLLQTAFPSSLLAHHLSFARKPSSHPTHSSSLSFTTTRTRSSSTFCCPSSFRASKPWGRGKSLGKVGGWEARGKKKGRGLDDDDAAAACLYVKMHGHPSHRFSSTTTLPSFLSSSQ